VTRLEPALVVILAGVCAALHAGKLPPAIPALQAALGLSLVQAGFLLSMVQAAGMTAGVAFGALADGLTPRRSMLTGLAVLAVASAAGARVDGVMPLMLLRACEGFGFLLVVLAAPALVRQLVAPQRLNLMLGLWGAYMPLATTLALLGGPLVIGAWGWRAWWWAAAVVSAAMALWLRNAVPRPAARAVPGPATNTTTPTPTANASGPPSESTRGTSPPPAAVPTPLFTRLARTLSAPGPWLLALAFAAYSGQWLAVIGFLPTIYAQGGSSLALSGALTAAAAAVNMAGNIGAGRLLHAGASPVQLLMLGFVAMGLCTMLAFIALPDAGHGTMQPLLPPALRFVAVLLFSGVGGLIPATLFTLAVRAAPGEGTLSTTLGWMQQWSAFGQFVGPPLVAWVAARAGGWHFTWVVTGTSTLLGLALSMAIAHHVVTRPTASVA
jgi:CP family cyanate transporter-like MFS transporter